MIQRRSVANSQYITVVAILDRLVLQGSIILFGTKQNTLLQYTPRHTTTPIQYTSHNTHPHTMYTKFLSFLGGFHCIFGFVCRDIFYNIFFTPVRKLRGDTVFMYNPLNKQYSTLVIISFTQQLSFSSEERK